MRAMYIVLHSRGQWWVDLEGRAHGPYRSREQAAEQAVELGRFLAHTGRQSEVRVADEAGHYRIVWHSGQEPSLAVGSPLAVEGPQSPFPRVASIFDR